MKLEHDRHDTFFRSLIFLFAVSLHYIRYIFSAKDIAINSSLSLSRSCLQVLGREKLPKKIRQRKTASTHQPTSPKVPFIIQMHVHLAINNRWVLFSCILYLFLFYLGRWGSVNYYCFVLLSLGFFKKITLGICSCD